MNEEISSLSAGINLVPQSTKKPQQVRHALLVAVTVLRYVLILVAIVGLGVVGYQMYMTSGLQGATDEITNQLSYINSKKEFQKNFVDLQAYANELGVIHRGLQRQSEIFAVLEQITPQIIVLNDLTINESEVRISGTTTAYPSITDYFDQLSSAEGFENVQIVNITRPTEEGENARITFTLSADIIKQL